jgi:phage tail-like protein
MRGHLPGLVSPHPLGPYLPAIYHEDPWAAASTIALTREEPFALRFTAALDEVAAPLFMAIDNVDAYLDPWLAPEDFLEWLGTWVAVQVDQRWPLDRQRAFVANAVDLFRHRGTVAGLKQHVELVFGGEAEIVENGGTAWSDVVDATIPGTSDYSLTVRLKVAKPKSVSAGQLDALVAAAKPAHIPHTVEVVAP